MKNVKTIQKWIGYFNFGWNTRYYEIDNAIFYYASSENLKNKKRAFFLGICDIKQNKNYLEFSTGSDVKYFKGETQEKTTEFQNMILDGISRGKEILNKNKQNIELVPTVNNLVEEEIPLNDSISLNSVTSSSIDPNNYQTIFQTLESKIKAPNTAFQNYIKNGYNDYDLKELLNQYKKIEYRLKKINENIQGFNLDT